MQQVCFTLRIKKDRIEDYLRPPGLAGNGTNHERRGDKELLDVY